MTTSNDKSCRCACFGNGVLGIVLAQILLFCGAMFSSASMGDCQLVNGYPLQWLPDPIAYPEQFNQEGFKIDLIENRGKGQPVGFFFWELENGDCSWHLFDEDLPEKWLETLWEEYFDLVLDSQWRMAVVFASIATFLGWSLFCWSLVLACLTAARPCRYLFATVLVMVIVCFQCLAFLVFRSNYCEESRFDCEMGSTGWFVIGASLCYMLAAVCFCVLMKNYPGGVSMEDEADVAPTKDVQEPQDEIKGEEVPEEPAPQAEDGPTAEAEEDPVENTQEQEAGVETEEAGEGQEENIASESLTTNPTHY